jgi:hypothetical protein
MSPGWPKASAQDVRFNELISSNGRGLTDENGDRPDWFELLNREPFPVDLDGWGVSDDRRRPFRWVFRKTVLQPQDYLVVFASGKNRHPLTELPLDPGAVGGLRLWLRADQVDTNDATAVRRSGSGVFVRRWSGSRGDEDQAAQPIEGRQPMWIVRGIGDLPALRFDGRDDLLRLARPPATNSFCLFAVFRTSRAHETDPEGATGVGGTSGQHYLFGAQHGGDRNAGAGLSVGTNGVAVYEHGSGYMPAVAVHAGALGEGGTLVAVNYDTGRAALDVQGLNARPETISPRDQVTAPVEIGQGAYGAFEGDLAEVLLFERSLSLFERAGIARFLADKYGLAIAEPRHTDFQINAAGEELWLTRPDGSVADQVTFGAIPRDVSYGRVVHDQERWAFFERPTPGSANITPSAVEFLPAPTLSQLGGFYREVFELALAVDHPQARIHYTLDGSYPTEDAPVYRSPLAIRGRAGTSNTISMIPTIPGGPVPSGEVFKGWVVRARSFLSNALPSATVTRTYWVDARGRDRYTLPVVSLATDRAHFFDPAVGIYVPGLAAGGNYSQRGPEWERPAHVELYDIDGRLAFGQEIGVKIHGNTSQGFPIKGLDLDGTSGMGREPFTYRVFPERDRTTFEHLLLRPTGHDQTMAFMRDELMQGLASETGAESQADRPCVVFLNGEYWGLHYLKEKQDAEYVAHYAGLAEEAIDYLEGYAAPKAGEVRHYQELLNYVANHDLAIGAQFQPVAARMEIANYIDYKACEVFFYRWDIGNHRLWRPRTAEGRWRWLQFDNDVGWGGFWAEQPAWQFDMLKAVLTPDGSLHGHNNEVTTFLLRRLMDHAGFREDFINRFQDLLNGLFRAEHTTAAIDRRAAVLAPEMAEHTRRWRAPSSLSQWQSQVQYLRSFAAQRPGFAREHLRRRFGLREPCVVSVGVSSALAGTIRLNTLEHGSPAHAPWTGLYFKGHPVALSAWARPGYRFERWEGLPGVTTNALRLALNGDVALVARFVPNPEDQPRFVSMRVDRADRVVLRASGTPQTSWSVEQSTDLLQWTALRTVDLDSNGLAEFVQPLSPGAVRQFFRLRAP